MGVLAAAFLAAAPSMARSLTPIFERACNTAISGVGYAMKLQADTFRDIGGAMADRVRGGPKMQPGGMS